MIVQLLKLDTTHKYRHQYTGIPLRSGVVLAEFIYIYNSHSPPPHE